jgi:tetratricopeptide (TPR) repeat protein
VATDSLSDTGVQTRRLLNLVAIRMHLGAFGRTVTAAFVGSAAVYASALILCRCVGWKTEWFTPQTVLIVPATAVLLASVLYRRPRVSDAARAVDVAAATEDLFLTAALLKSSPGEFQPLVTERAERQAARVKPSLVAPFNWERRAAWMLGSALVLAAALNLMPTFDPFGLVAEARQTEQRVQSLEDSKKATELRIAELKTDENKSDLSPETKAALEKLKKNLNSMKRNRKEENLKSLMSEQKQLGEQWRKLSAEQLKNVLSQNQDAQQFGARDREKMEQWSRELREGSTKSLEKALEDIREDLQRLARNGENMDPAEKRALQEEIKKKMKDLEEFATEKVNSKPLAAALQRAMKQLESSKFEGMSEKGSEAAQESLELAKMELQELAQSAKDLQALEQAMKVIQQAKRVNEEEQLDGEMTSAAEALEEYAELYAQLIGGMQGDGEGDGDEGDGDSDGTGGRGMGRGGKPPEDDTIDTAYKDEFARTTIQQGKVLLSVKTKGMSDRGEAQKNYRTVVEQVKQGVNDAIDQEQVPPGYHDSIKSYFDNLKPDSVNGASVRE